MPASAGEMVDHDRSRGSAQAVQRRSELLRVGLIALGVVAVAVWRAIIACKGETSLSDDPIWNLLELLIVPLALVYAAYYLEREQRRREEMQAEEHRRREKIDKEERERQEKAAFEERLKIERQIARKRHHQATHESYLTFMSHYVTMRRFSDSQKMLMRVRTLLVLDSLHDDDGEQRSKIYSFLGETKLLSEVGLFREFPGLKARDFTAASLSEADLTKSDLSKAVLKEADLRKVVLNGANLTRADLTSAILDEAICEDVTLDEAVLCNARLTSIRLPRASLRGTRLVGCSLEQAILTDADLTNACLESANLQGAKLDGAFLHGSKLDSQTQLDEKWRLVWRLVNRKSGEDVPVEEGQNLIRANLRGANISGLVLQRANLQSATLIKAVGQGVNLQGAVLTNARCNEADFSDADLSSADLTGTDLTGAVLSRCNLRGAIINESTQLELKWRRVWAILERQPIEVTSVELLESEAARENPWESTHDGIRGPNLSEVDLSDAYLASADLSHVNLRGANLRGAVLTNANLDFADLTLSNLREAKVSLQQLVNAKTDGAYLPERFVND